MQFYAEEVHFQYTTVTNLDPTPARVRNSELEGD
jgi:hypothetical protein